MMIESRGNNRKGQMKIQQMAFVLVALIIFFAIIVLIYMRIRIANIESSAQLTGEEYAKGVVAKMVSAPEFSWIDSCGTCVDIGKVWALKNVGNYSSFWNLDYLEVEIVYPDRKGECNDANFPNCESITLINKTSNVGASYSAFINLCRTEGQIGNSYIKCELGRIWASGGGIGSKK